MPPPIPPASDDGKVYGEGCRLNSASPEELRWAIEAAFDYRGDVTLTLQSGESISGYIFNRNVKAAEPYLDFYPQNSDDKRRLLYRDIRAIDFTGRDPASGKSWATWVKQYQEKKAARARGENIGRIGLDAEPLA
ncbi:MAG: hypothetical protein HY717_22515 [Planctomycetes bacterium]|nr:hypothetical protein [Planctomycetota bacterium]